MTAQVWATIAIAVLGGTLTIGGFLLKRYLDGLVTDIKEAKDDASEAVNLARAVEIDLLKYKIHVAENYIGKEDFASVATVIQKQISDLDKKVDAVLTKGD